LVVALGKFTRLAGFTISTFSNWLADRYTGRTAGRPGRRDDPALFQQLLAGLNSLLEKWLIDIDARKRREECNVLGICFVLLGRYRSREDERTSQSEEPGSHRFNLSDLLGVRNLHQVALLSRQGSLFAVVGDIRGARRTGK
jgi:hypothetical protein